MARCIATIIARPSTHSAKLGVLERRCQGGFASVYATAFEYNLTASMGYETGREVWGKYLERFVVTIYATGPLGVLVAYFVLRVEVSFDRVVMTLLTHTSPTKTAAESVAASAFGSK
jgi:hypothetical protein